MLNQFTPFDYPICFASPRYLTDDRSWHEQIPFAFACIAMLRPRVFVEIGTRKGDSYCAFCQAVDELAHETKCYAVDHWQGDKHVGLYGTGVLEQFRAYHDPRYGKFSQLISSTFDEARHLFNNKSIDLLHIDGFHTYEVVKHNFQNWLPAMSDRGVVLFHDTQVRDDESSVWKLWEEIKGRFPNFELKYGHGLGVLAVGEKLDPIFRNFLDTANNDPLVVSEFFHALGRGVALQALLTEQKRESEFNRLNSELAVVKAAMAERDKQLTAIEASLAWRVIGLYRTMKETGLPLGSRRRKLYEDLLQECRKSVARAIDSFSRGTRKNLFRLRGIGVSPELDKQDIILKGGNNLLQTSAKLKEELQRFLADTNMNLEFPLGGDPRISVVIVTYNKAEFTFQCLRSLLSHVDLPYEIIIVDNASTDETLCLLERVKNATVIKNTQNFHFIHGCNQATTLAKGRYLLFLNNDTLITEGVLSTLVNTIERASDIGAVGAKFVWPNGKLQEAGSILWSDGSALGYGRGDDPEKAEYCYLREVDYCSAACLLVVTDLFQRLKGFDPRYFPAYYEDSDLCMGIRTLGYRILFQPKAIVIHHEFTSSSAQHAIQLCRQNQPTFVGKWHDRLLTHLKPSVENILKARDKNIGKRVLVFDDRIPTPHRGAGYPRMFKILTLLADMGCSVTFIPVLDTTKWEPDTGRLQQLGVEAFYGSFDIAELLERRKGVYEAVMVSRPHNAASVIPLVRKFLPEALLIYDAEALFYRREVLQAQLNGREELKLISMADKVITVSERERELIAEETNSDKNVWVLAHAHETYSPRTAFPKRSDILFVGGFLSSPSPNEDAILHFAKDIFPQILQKLPSLRLIVVGADPPKSVADLSSPSICIKGHVDDLREYYESCRIFINPVRYAAGIPLKLTEAMSFGLPAVVSDLAGASLKLNDGEQVLICKNEQEFVEKVITLYQNESLWLKLQQTAFRYIKDHFHQKKMEDQLADILELRSSRTAHGSKDKA